MHVLLNLSQQSIGKIEILFVPRRIEFMESYIHVYVCEWFVYQVGRKLEYSSDNQGGMHGTQSTICDKCKTPTKIIYK